MTSGTDLSENRELTEDEIKTKINDNLSELFNAAKESPAALEEAFTRLVGSCDATEGSIETWQ